MIQPYSPNVWTPNRKIERVPLPEVERFPGEHEIVPARCMPTGIMAQRMPLKALNRIPQNVFASDNFTDTNGTLLQNHADNLGLVPNTWSLHAGDTMSIQSNKLICDGAFSWYRTGVAPTSADYEVVADFTYVSARVNDYAGILARFDSSVADCYMVRINGNLGRVEGYKVVASSFTSLFNTASTLSVGTTYRLRLVVQNSRILFYMDNALIADITDTSVTAAGRAGVYGQNAMSSSQGIHIDNFFAQYPVVNDSMTATNGTSLTSHTGERGATWTKFGGTDATIDSNRVHQDDVGSQDYQAVASGVPLSANCIAEADMYVASQLADSYCGISARNNGVDTNYYLRYSRNDTVYQFIKFPSGTLLGSSGGTSPGVASVNRMQIYLNGSTLKAIVGTSIFVYSGTDTAISVAGFTGVRLVHHATSTTGYHFDNFWYTNWPGVPGDTPPVIS